MMKILVTGFEPFGGESLNPSWEAVKLLPENIAGAEIIKQLLPTEFLRAEEALLSAIDGHNPHAVLCTGQAAGRGAISFERVAINLRDASIADNAGYKPSDEAVCPGEREAYFVSLPVKAMAAAVKEAGLPSELSLSAGAYVCNDVLYTLLRRCSETGALGGFVHLPLSTEQAEGKTPPLPSMSIEDMAKGLKEAIRVLAEQIRCVIELSSYTY